MSDKATVLSEFARVMATQDPARPFAHRLCLAGVQMLRAEGAAVTVAYTSPNRVTVCATDERAERLEDLQDVLGQGPGPTAYRTGQQVTAHLGGPDERWPEFAVAAGQAFGDLVLYAIPIRPDRRVLAVLTCHQPDGQALALDPVTAQFLADAIGVALLDDPQIHLSDTSGPWSSRAIIHQATGMVIAQLAVGPEDALALLRAHAFARGATLLEIATDVLHRRIDFSTDPELGKGTP